MKSGIMAAVVMTRLRLGPYCGLFSYLNVTLGQNGHFFPQCIIVFNATTHNIMSHHEIKHDSLY